MCKDSRCVLLLNQLKKKTINLKKNRVESYIQRVHTEEKKGYSF